MDNAKRWIVQKPDDDVATALTTLRAGEEIVDDVQGIRVVLVQDIMFGHKFALRDLGTGHHVHKYGQVIGGATKPIRAGEHVHVHNLESLRGRGDLHAGDALVEEGKG